VAPAGGADVAPSQEARSRSAPDEGAALNGWDPSDEGRRKCRLDNVRIWSSGPAEKRGGFVKNRPQVERREARVLVTARGTSMRCQT
jgi:hypothetical protein